VIEAPVLTVRVTDVEAFFDDTRTIRIEASEWYDRNDCTFKDSLESSRVTPSRPLDPVRH